MKKLLSSSLAAAVVGTMFTVLPATPANAASAAPAPAQAGKALKQRSLATVLAADGQRFDRNWGDYDVLDKAVGAVLKAKPDSAVAVLADGSVTLTAFLPTDRAFRRLVHSLTGKLPARESGTFNKLVAAAGVDTIEQVLLYHVVPGARITYAQARKADGATLKTAQGATLGVNVRKHGRIALVDRDPDARNAVIKKNARNINKNSRQIAHGIDRVLRPINL